MKQDKPFKEKEGKQLVVNSTSDNAGTGDLTEPVAASDQLEAHEKTLLPGTIIAGHYEVLSMIGCGAMGTVYKVKHLLVDQIRAVKLLRTSDSQILRRFQQEAKASLVLQHENIVRVFEFGIEPQLQQPYLVMEFVEGETLSTILKNEERLNHDRVCVIVEQICNALSHSHANEIVHRDIKPANIIIAKGSAGEEIVKLVDFGIAKITSPQDGQNLTQTGEVFGTPLYMSPEQCLGQKVDSRSDIYSLGCVIYECFAGKPPFQGASSLETIMMHASGSIPKFAADIPNSVKLVILKSLEKPVQFRYQSALALKDALISAPMTKSNLLTSLRTEWVAMRRKPEELRKALMVVCLLIPFVFITFCMFLASDAQKEKIHNLEQRVTQAKIDSVNDKISSVKHQQDLLKQQSKWNGDLIKAIRPSLKAELIVEKRDDPAAWVGIASELEQKGNLVDAERAFRKSIQLKTNYKPAWLGLSKVLLKQRRTKEAEEALKRANNLNGT